MKTLNHEFVTTIPSHLNDDILYISMDYGTIAHKCCCGCGNKVITPLTPTDWKITYNGETISLFPSIGNWNLPCQSHYWIKNSEVHFAGKWTRDMVEEEYYNDKEVKRKHYTEKNKEEKNIKAQIQKPQKSRWGKFLNWIKK